MADMVTETAHHAASAGLPQFNAEWFPSQLFWLAVTFAILYVFFSRFALPRLAAGMDLRADQIRGDIQSAEQLAARAQTIREGYERNMAKAREQSTESLRTVDKKIKEKAADLLYAYRTKVTAELTRAEENLDRERGRLIGDMHHLAAETAAQAAGQILGGPVDVETAHRVVTQLGQSRQRAA
jgi:F-type H+-transporting ATPase subunit b